MSDLTELAIFAVGILLVLGIGFYIARDARRVAPVADPEHPDGSEAAEQHRRSNAKRSRDRAKAKRAKQARRYNRTR